MRAAPTTYDPMAHSSAAKLAVNEWLAQLAGVATGATALPSPPSPSTCSALILDTRALTTTRALSALASIPPARIVVPNVDAAECAAMRAAAPGLIALPTTSHALLASLRGTAPLPPAAAAVVAAAASEMPRTFSFVWLDYCGNLTSRAGRARQRDVEALFASPNRLVQRGSVVAVTMCKRGNVEMYEDELVDTLALSVDATARRSGVRVEVAGVATYAKPLPMYTVAFRVLGCDDDDDDDDDDCDGSGGSGGALDAPPAAAAVAVRHGATFTTGWDAHPLPGARTVLRAGAERDAVAASFVAAVDNAVKRCGDSAAVRALAIESSALAVSLALLRRCATRGGGVVRVLSVLPQAVAAAAAALRLQRWRRSAARKSSSERAVSASLPPWSALGDDGFAVERRAALRWILAPPGTASSARVVRARAQLLLHPGEEEGEAADAGAPRPLVLPPLSPDAPIVVGAVWLDMSSGRSRAFTAAQLQRAASWRVLNAVFETEGLLGSAGGDGILGLRVYVSSIGQCWEGSFVDWIVAAVSTCAAWHHRAVETLAVHQLNVVQNRLALIFRISNGAGTSEPRPSASRSSSSSSAAAAPAVVLAWDAARPKKPSAESLKFGSISEYVAVAVRHAAVLSVVLAEPGFHWLLPALLLHSGGLANSAAHVTCVSRDRVQLSDVASRPIVSEGGGRAGAGTLVDRVACVVSGSSGDEGLHSAMKNARAAVLLSEGGVAAWREEWLSEVGCWARGLASHYAAAAAAAALPPHAAPQVSPGFLALMHEASDLKAADALGEEIKALLRASGVVALQDISIQIRTQSRRFAFRTFFAASTEDDVARELARWGEVRPERVESRHFSRKRLASELN